MRRYPPGDPSLDHRPQPPNTMMLRSRRLSRSQTWFWMRARSSVAKWRVEPGQGSGITQCRKSSQRSRSSDSFFLFLFRGNDVSTDALNTPSSAPAVGGRMYVLFLLQDAQSKSALRAFPYKIQVTPVFEESVAFGNFLLPNPPLSHSPAQSLG